MTTLIETNHLASFDLTGSAERMARALRVAATFASTDRGRVLLTAVRIHSNGAGTVVADASNSYMLARVTLTSVMADDDDYVPAFDVNVPAKWLTANLPKGRHVIGFGLDVTDDTVAIRNHDDGTIAQSPLIPGAFPNVDKIITDSEPGGDMAKETGFNPKYLALLLKACGAWGAGTQPVRTRWLDPMKATRFDVQSPDGHLIAALMPVRLP